MKELTGWNYIRRSWFQMLVYIVMIICILYFLPPLWVTLLIIYASIIIKAIYEKKFKPIKILKGMAISTAFIMAFYILYHLVGGWPAIIIAHIIGGGMILYYSWAFIKQQWTSLKYCLDKGIKEPRRRRKEWERNQKSQKLK